MKYGSNGIGVISGEGMTYRARANSETFGLRNFI